ncbi:hypothetical protein SDRG_04621 [Saprolegnia diclina VS20]|uniref:Temptin Cys/Cys disulfide domain-containing protein n=1 Tax=Saprolegnia diclina (strain VS20) TaxID=1156394 RepID=T0S641_SAPDV|nr:hypothetical protein SDRG_04621 [Saprolegnia diclina VS20]EQC38192.1 hypothetical protein SDRG_04621 [Saprolegnia diclina VS20]|eukprot:XP_008608519.1 hypothetical protein SDRG_04621 [Saprolegnia diclina VS20]
MLLVRLLTLAASTSAYSEFRYNLPNGFEVSGVPAIGHENKAGGGAYTPFGHDFMQLRMDNRLLGDPCCLWTSMDETPLRGNPTSPGHANAFTADELAELRCDRAKTEL